MIVQHICPDCQGDEGFTVTRDMAIDAGDIQMADTWVSCLRCQGDGFILQEVEDAK